MHETSSGGSVSHKGDKFRELKPKFADEEAAETKLWLQI